MRLLENRILALKNQEDDINKKIQSNKIRQKYLDKKKKEKNDFKQTLLSYDIDKRNELDEKRKAIKEQKNQLNKDLQESIQKNKISKIRNYQKLQKEKKMVLTIIDRNNHNFEKYGKNNVVKIKKQREKIKSDGVNFNTIIAKKNFYGQNKLSNLNSNIINNKSDVVEINKKYSTIQFQSKETENNNSDDFPFAQKRNNRKNEELIEFIRKKKIKARKEERNKEYEKKKKLFEIFKNLSNLKDSYNNYTSINNSSSIFKKRNRKNILKYKEINEYYIGTDSSRNGSTILDLNEYYLNILESQQLLVNSGLNKIHDL